MATPSSSLATLRPDLSAAFEEYDLAMNMNQFVAARVLRPIYPQTQAGKFWKIPVEQLLQERDTKRAPGSGYSRGKWKFEEDSYATVEHGAEEPLDDRERHMYGSVLQQEQVCTSRGRSAVLLNAEKRAADLVFNTTTWTGATLTTAASASWDTVGTDVINDVKLAQEKVWTSSGLWPNAMIINRHTFRKLRKNTAILAQISSSGAGDQQRTADVTVAQIAACLDVDELIVAGGAYNSASEGQSATFAKLWSDDYAMVCRIAMTDDPKEPCIARTLFWTADGGQPNGTVEKYRDEAVRSDIIRCRHDVDEKLLYAAAGHLISGCT